MTHEFDSSGFEYGRGEQLAQKTEILLLTDLTQKLSRSGELHLDLGYSINSDIGNLAVLNRFTFEEEQPNRNFVLRLSEKQPDNDGGVDCVEILMLDFSEDGVLQSKFIVNEGEGLLELQDGLENIKRVLSDIRSTSGLNEEEGELLELIEQYIFAQQTYDYGYIFDERRVKTLLELLCADKADSSMLVGYGRVETDEFDVIAKEIVMASLDNQDISRSHTALEYDNKDEKTETSFTMNDNSWKEATIEHATYQDEEDEEPEADYPEDGVESGLTRQIIENLIAVAQQALAEERYNSEEYDKLPKPWDDENLHASLRDSEKLFQLFSQAERDSREKALLAPLFQHVFVNFRSKLEKRLHVVDLKTNLDMGKDALALVAMLGRSGINQIVLSSPDILAVKKSSTEQATQANVTYITTDLVSYIPDGETQPIYKAFLYGLVETEKSDEMAGTRSVLTTGYIEVGTIRLVDFVHNCN